MKGSSLGETPTLGMMRQELLELVRREGEMLADIKASLDMINGYFDGMTLGLCDLHRNIRGFALDIDGFRQDIDRLRRDLPDVVRKAVREAFHEGRDRKL